MKALLGWRPDEGVALRARRASVSGSEGGVSDGVGCDDALELRGAVESVLGAPQRSSPNAERRPTLAQVGYDGDH